MLNFSIYKWLLNNLFCENPPCWLIVFVFSLSQTGYIGALPHLLMTIVVPLGGLLADHIRKNGILSTTSVRKIFNCGGFGMEATFFLVLANARTPLMATIALTCGVAFSGFAISGKPFYISVSHNSTELQQRKNCVWTNRCIILY